MSDEHEEWDEIVAEGIEEDRELLDQSLTSSFFRWSTDHAPRRPTPRALSMVEPAGDRPDPCDKSSIIVLTGSRSRCVLSGLLGDRLVV